MRVVRRLRKKRSRRRPGRRIDSVFVVLSVTLLAAEQHKRMRAVLRGAYVAPRVAHPLNNLGAKRAGINIAK